MSGFIDEADRSQGTLLPERVEEYVSEENPVRVIDAFVCELDLAKLGFEGTEPKSTGRPGYHPATMLKIYLYGYLNRIQSSRRLEQEARRNLELMWLVGRLAPDFKTLADFRAENAAAIKNVCREFIVLCRNWGLLTEATVAIDGSKFKAVNHRDRNFTPGKMKTRMALIEQSIAEYLRQLDRMDRKETPSSPRGTARLKERIATLKEEMQRLEGLKAQMEASPDGQVSLTDPDARSMVSQGKGTGIVGYNVQTAVDTKHHLIVTHEVTNVGSDRHQLKKMAEAAREALGTSELTAIADRGYYSGKEILFHRTPDALLGRPHAQIGSASRPLIHPPERVPQEVERPFRDCADSCLLLVDRQLQPPHEFAHADPRLLGVAPSAQDHEIIRISHDARAEACLKAELLPSQHEPAHIQIRQQW